MTDQSNPAPLLPCPHCGGKPSFGVVPDNPGDSSSGGQFITCEGCGASTWLMFALMDDVHPFLAERWNRRAALAAPAPRLTDERIEHLWDIHVGDPTAKYPLEPKDVLLFARAIEAEVRRPVESAPDRVAMAEHVKQLALGYAYLDARHSVGAVPEDVLLTERRTLFAAIDALATSAVAADASLGVAAAPPGSAFQPPSASSTSIPNADSKDQAIAMLMTMWLADFEKPDDDRVRRWMTWAEAVVLAIPDSDDDNAALDLIDASMSKENQS